MKTALKFEVLENETERLESCIKCKSADVYVKLSIRGSENKDFSEYFLCSECNKGVLDSIGKFITGKV